MKIGKLLKIYVDMNDLGVRDLAKEIGVSHSTISRILNGRSTDITNAFKFLAWLFTD